jgi:RNA polymerase sigma-70 factor (ECF subfamily)
LSSSTETPDGNYAPESSDEELMLVLQGGQDSALDDLMKRHKQPLYHFIVNYTRDDDISYDLLQETFCRVFTRSETYNSTYKFKTWLYQIALNLCRDYSRKKKLLSIMSLDTFFRSEENGSLHDVLPSDANIESLTEHRQTLKLLGKHIDKLPHKLKTALILFALENHSQEECARILGVTPKTVEMRVYRARKILMQKLANNF